MLNAATPVGQGPQIDPRLSAVSPIRPQPVHAGAVRLDRTAACHAAVKRLRCQTCQGKKCIGLCRF